jgi:ubiquinone/menaquinone biosynthesis C-methylase UbiE
MMFDLTHNPFPDETIDEIILRYKGALRAQVIQECNRVLKPEGALLINPK